MSTTTKIPPGQLVTRREALALLGGTGAALLLGCGDSNAGPPGLSCLESPEQFEGPFFVDDMLHRSDLRVDPTDNSVQPGVPLALTLTVHAISGGSCIPLAGANVDLWLVNAQGVYSDILNHGTLGKKFLRGYQLTDANGRVQFMAIYPGWYTGRTPHIHVKIRMYSGQVSSVFTSQLYFDDSVTNVVYAGPLYNTRRRDVPTNEADVGFSGPSEDGRIARPSGQSMLLALSPTADGYSGSLNLGLRIG